MSSSASFAPLIARLRRGSDRMSARSSMGLACILVVESVGQTTTPFDSRRVVDVVADHYMMEDRVDRCSS